MEILSKASMISGKTGRTSNGTKNKKNTGMINPLRLRGSLVAMGAQARLSFNFPKIFSREMLKTGAKLHLMLELELEESPKNFF